MSTSAQPEMASDPMDNFDITKDDLADETPLPETMILGGKPQEEVKPEPEAKTVEPALPEGYKKDSRGRIHRPDGTLATKDEIAKFTTPPPQHADTPTDASKAPETVPFKYRALSTTHEPKGFVQNADGSVTVTADNVGELRAALNAKHVMEADTFPTLERLKGENATLAQQVEALKTGTTAEIARSKVLVEHLTKDLLTEPDEAKAVERFFQLRTEWPARLAKAEADHWRTVAQQGKPSADQHKAPQAIEGSPYTPGSLPPRDQAVAATTDSIETIRLESKYRDLSDADWKQFTERQARTPYAYIRPATADEAKQYPGVREGQSVFDTDAVAADIEEYASTVRSAREREKSAATLAANNARRTQPGITAPPTPGGGAQPAKQPRRITNEKEWNEYMDSDEL